jgi:hypothetical protein
MYSKWCSSKEFRCHSSNLSHHYPSSSSLYKIQ